MEQGSGHGEGERPRRSRGEEQGREDEQGSGREQPAVEMRNEKRREQSSSQRGRELTLGGPWLAGRSSVRRHPSGFQARVEDEQRRRPAPAGTSSSVA